MRKLAITENVTLDGVIEATGGWFAWDDDEIDLTDVDDSLREQREAADALIMGRVTFEEMRGYWPLQTDDRTGVTDYLNRVDKYVVSRTMQDPGWERSTVLSGRLEDEIGALKAAAGKDIVATGSVTLVRDLIRTGLVDEYRLFVYPIVLGTGERLFADATEMPKLELVEARPFRSGIVLLRHRVA
jgi:dihydrofolate reductase